MGKRVSQTPEIGSMWLQKKPVRTIADTRFWVDDHEGKTALLLVELVHLPNAWRTKYKYVFLVNEQMIPISFNTKTQMKRFFKRVA